MATPIGPSDVSMRIDVDDAEVSAGVDALATLQKAAEDAAASVAEVEASASTTAQAAQGSVPSSGDDDGGGSTAPLGGFGGSIIVGGARAAGGGRAASLAGGLLAGVSLTTVIALLPLLISSIADLIATFGTEEKRAVNLNITIPPETRRSLEESVAVGTAEAVRKALQSNRASEIQSRDSMGVRL